MRKYIDIRKLEKEKLDILGMPLKVGDWIATAESAYGNGYRLSYGKIHSFTTHFINLCDDNGDKCGRKAFDKVMKITAQIKYNKENYPEYFL